MKKILLSLSVLMSAGAVSAQTDTLTEFFTGTPTIYSVGAANGGGYVSGNNGYDDIAKFQLFDATHGVSGFGSITNVLLWAPVKSDGGGSFMVKVWADNAGQPGTELGSQTLTLASVDTTVATGYMVAEGAVLYNVSASFNIPIPANQKFWAGVVLPTVVGDTLALVTNTDGNFADAATHTGEFWSDGTFHSFGDPMNWDLAIALAIFPVVNFTSTGGVNFNEISVSVYPNPANDKLNVKLNEVAESVSIISMDGKVVSTQLVNATSTVVDVTGLNAGVYIYEVKTANGTVRNTFMKK